ncbi:MAG: VCBS repeat-containing protein [Nannocystaceae bacterium]
MGRRPPRGAALCGPLLTATIAAAASCGGPDSPCEGSTRLCQRTWRELVPAWSFDRAALVDRGDGERVLVAIAVGGRESAVIDRAGATQTKLDGDASAIAAGDLDGDGVDEIAVGLALPASVLVFTLDGRALIERGAVACETAPRDLISADVDGDGRHEFISADGEAGTLSTITLAARGEVVRATSRGGLVPVALRAGDLDDDGRADVVALDFTSGDLFVQMGAAGGLGPARRWAVDPASTTLALGDVDGDGALDVVVRGLADGLSVLYGDGAGDLSAPFVVMLEADAPDEQDIDLAPLIVTPSVDALGGLAVVGDGELRTTLLTAAGVPEGGRARLGMDIAGRPVTLSGGGLLFRGLRDVGLVEAIVAPVPIERWRRVFDPSVPPPQSLGAGGQSLAIADLDGDGVVDLAVGHDVLCLYFGDGHGGYEEGSSVGLADLQALTVADVNGDGRLDLVARRGDELFVARGEGGRGFALLPSAAAVADTSALVGVRSPEGARVLALAASREGEPGALATFAEDAAPAPATSLVSDLQPRSAAVADLDGDLAEDLVVLGRRGADASAPWAVQAHRLGDGAATRQPAHDLVGADADRWVVGPALGDVDLDGEPEALLVTELGIHRVDDLASAAPEETFQPLAIAIDGDGHAAVAEVDGDGRPDLAILSRSGLSALLGGASGFSPLDSGRYDLPFRRIAAGDLDGDGRLDLVGHSATEVSALLLETRRSPRVRERWLLPPLQSTVVGDLDGDGNLDLLHGAPDAIAVTFDPLGEARRETLNLEAASVMSPVIAVDLDGDGRDEGIVVSFTTSPSIVRWLDDGLRVEPWPLEWLRADTRVAGPYLVDADGDGRLDVIALLDDRVVIAYGEAEASAGPWPAVGAPQLVASGVRPPLVLGDASGDGLPELVLRLEDPVPEADAGASASPAMLVAIASGRQWHTQRVAADDAVIREAEADLLLRRDGALVRRPIYGTRVAPEIVVVEDEALRDGHLIGAIDLDGDGESDVISAHLSHLNVWRGRSGVLVHEAEIPLLSELFGGVTLADLDGDGRGEILVGTALFSDVEEAP